MLKIKRALVSVSDKTGLVDLCTTLKRFNVEILSTGGTARTLRENGIGVVDVSDYTGFPEMLDGRVKTLHPRIHGGLLALRDNPAHMQTLKEHGIGLIDMVVVNLYPFQQVIQKAGVRLEEAIENIDIGGPSMLRSAAKNGRSVAVVPSPSFYPKVIGELERNAGALSEETLFELAVSTFEITSQYDAAIHEFLRNRVSGKAVSAERFPSELRLAFKKVQDLRYGENPHQKAAFYRDAGTTTVAGLTGMRQLWGKELSFNNILDVNAAVGLAREFERPAVVFIKHNNPCGVAEHSDILFAYRQAWACDKLSAFGGIVAINRGVDLALARLIAKSGFLECIVAPSFRKESLEVLKEKKNVRLLELSEFGRRAEGVDFKRVDGGLLLQDTDEQLLNEKDLKVVTKKRPTAKEMESLIFAWKVAKHVKSNAIILARGTRTVGIGAGQMSRVDSVYIATKKAGALAAGSVLASDAFFPKEDAVELAAKHKIKCIIQPGGSIADREIIQTADRRKIAMVMTGMRHFRH